MSVARIFIMSLITMLVLSLGTNGIVAAASGVSHEMHCADHGKEISDHHSAAHTSNLKLLGSMTSETGQHDHEACMFHACSAMFAEEVDYGAIPYLLFVRLQYLEPKLKPAEQAEKLLRPPKK